MLCQTTKPVQSFILVDSEKIQERAKVVLEACRKLRAADDEKYIREWMERANRNRNRWPRWWFGSGKYNSEQAKVEILRQKQADLDYPGICEIRHWTFPAKMSIREEIAERLLAMSKVERRVAVSSHDFAWFFR